MIDIHPLFESLFEFSRSHCTGICAFLVPANLLATLQTLIFVGIGRPAVQVRLINTVAILYALLMVLHVATWFMIDVVMMPTFVLLSLGAICLGINTWAIAHPQSMATFLQSLVRWVTHKANPLFAGVLPIAQHQSIRPLVKFYGKP